MSAIIRISIAEAPDLDPDQVMGAIRYLVDDFGLTEIDAEGQPTAVSTPTGQVSIGPLIEYLGDGSFVVYGLLDNCPKGSALTIFQRELASYLNKHALVPWYSKTFVN